MDQIILKANFQRPDDGNYWHEFMEEFQRWERDNRDNFTKQMVINAWGAFEKKVCRSDFPSESSCGYYMGYHLIHSLTSMTG